VRLVFWGLVAVAICWVAYGVMMSAWQYFEVAGVVDDALRSRNVADIGTARTVKDRILKASAESGIPLDADDVNVSLENQTYSVNVIWSFPILIYQGQPVLRIPMSLSRTKQAVEAFYLPAGRAFASAIIRSTRVRSSPGGETFTNRSHERIAPAGSFFAS
jgi:hypothetical protein